jgi:hypothetical protein
MRLTLILLVLLGVGCAEVEDNGADEDTSSHVEVTGEPVAVGMLVGPFQVLSCTYGDYGEVCRDVTDQYAIVEGLLCLSATPDVCEMEAANETGRLLVYRL